MTPLEFKLFPQANCKFGPPPGTDESQCMTVAACVGRVSGGNMDGAGAVVVAWVPTREERVKLAAGHPIYLCSLSGMPMHFLSVEFPAEVVPVEQPEKGKL